MNEFLSQKLILEALLKDMQAIKQKYEVLRYAKKDLP